MLYFWTTKIVLRNWMDGFFLACKEVSDLIIANVHVQMSLWY